MAGAAVQGGGVPESFTWFIGGLFSWLFRPVVLAVMIAAFLVSEGWVLASRSMADALSWRS